jgi:N-acetylglucosaminyldiphosphoundecaprenol N-acetyl-beta-D-mannosaminyltransferase
MGGLPRVSPARTTEVFGIRCFRGTLEDAVQLVLHTATSGGGGYGCLCNVHVLETAHRSPRVMRALDGARIVFPDGGPITWMQRLSDGDGPAQRVGGPDLMTAVVREGCSIGLRHALYGSTNSVLERLQTNLRGLCPRADVVAAIAPPFGAGRDATLGSDLERLRSVRPHIVWVALGAPVQELWAAEHAPALSPAFVVGVGAAFEFLSGVKRRAPGWMQQTNLEWLHRLATEPRRLGPRYVTTNSSFLARVSLHLTRQAARWGQKWT